MQGPDLASTAQEDFRWDDAQSEGCLCIEFGLSFS